MARKVKLHGRECIEINGVFYASPKNDNLTDRILNRAESTGNHSWFPDDAPPPVRINDIGIQGGHQWKRVHGRWKLVGILDEQDEDYVMPNSPAAKLPK